jgi:hypothetical protein
VSQVVLKPGEYVTHRTVVGVPVTADPAISATFPLQRQNLILSEAYKEARLQGAGVNTVQGLVTLAGGASPTVTLECYLYDNSTDTFTLQKTTTALSTDGNFTYTTGGVRSFLRISAVTGAPTSVTIQVSPGGTGDQTRILQWRVVENATDQTVDTTVGGDLRIHKPMVIRDVGAYCDTAGTTGECTVDINEGGTTILSTKITIDTGEKSSQTAATPPVISDSSIAADAVITVDVDTIHTGTAAKGLVVWMEVEV